MEHQYIDSHSILEREYLERGNKLREELSQAKLSPEEFDKVLNLKLDFIFARLPVEFWEGRLPPRVPRSLVKELSAYVANCVYMYRYGLGLSLVSLRFNSKVSALYYLCGALITKGYKCFTSSYSQLVYLLRESRDDVILKEELAERFKADFFFLLDVPETDEIPAFVKQDLLAHLELRLVGERSVLFTAETGATSLNELPTDSLLGRVLIPFAKANKLIRVEDNMDLDLLYEDRWGLVSGTS